MSEVTTGAVIIEFLEDTKDSIVCKSKSTAKLIDNKFKDLLDNIKANDYKINELDNLKFSSPKELEKQMKEMKDLITDNTLFKEKTKGLSLTEKETLTASMISENNPLKSFMPNYLEDVNKGSCSFETAVKKSTKDFAEHNINKVNSIVKDAANFAGFSSESKVIKNKDGILDIVFKDEQGRKLTTYSKLNKNLNPSLALDLEGFDTSTKACSIKMNKVITYLNEHGVPFKYKILKHNKLNGVLRKAINKKSNIENSSISDYLKDKGTTKQNKSRIF